MRRIRTDLNVLGAVFLLAVRVRQWPFRLLAVRLTIPITPNAFVRTISTQRAGMQRTRTEGSALLSLFADRLQRRVGLNSRSTARSRSFHGALVQQRIHVDGARHHSARNRQKKHANKLHLLSSLMCN